MQTGGGEAEQLLTLLALPISDTWSVLRLLTMKPPSPLLFLLRPLLKSMLSLLLPQFSTVTRVVDVGTDPILFAGGGIKGLMERKCSSEVNIL